MTTTLASPYDRVIDRVRAAAAPRVSGRVGRVVGLNLEVEGLDAAIGDGLEVHTAKGRLPLEVVAVGDRGLVSMPFGDLTGVGVGDPVTATGSTATIRVGDALLGRVLDGLGRPIDDGPPLEVRGSDDPSGPGLVEVGIDGTPPHPLRRRRVDTPLGLGVRAVDTLITCGQGQRMGIFAGSGVGKSSLLSMIARGSEADVTVLALIGERGREVAEFIEHDLGPEGLARSVVVVATSDQPALVRLRAAFVATRIAEHFRDQGRDVLLMMDSLTRFAMAQREVGLSAGEPPATRGYPPSVFTLLPKLLERAGCGETGSITGLYTVLVEGDDMQDPVGDTARSILDGHIVLSRRLATAGHFPTIDVLESASRVAGRVTSPENAAAATELRRLMAALRDARDLVDIGAYAAGSNPDVDRALQLDGAITRFLRQPLGEQTHPELAWRTLRQILGHGRTDAGVPMAGGER
ncbi:FliI/YscN family ATPase [Euzebya sp.]|uniref:FliI/YscN family ATPase n=1 Tax=Euzebya sp. TaxID=1971409 RepID=UPI003511C2FB